VREVALRYCNVAGDDVETTWDQARADLIIEGLPVRIPPSYRGQRSYPGLFWASKNRRMLVYESLLELERLWMADFDATVTAIATQPFQVAGLDGGVRRVHVPDVLLTHHDDRVTVVDVKPKQLLNKPEVRAQFTWTQRLCQAKGWNYEVFTGGDAVIVRNIKTAALGRRPERLPAGLLDLARATVTAEVATLGDLLARKPPGCDEAAWRAAVMALVWSGVIDADLTRPMNEATAVLIPEMASA